MNRMQAKTHDGPGNYMGKVYQLYYMALLKSRYKKIFMQQAYFILLLTNPHTVRCIVKIPYFQGLITSLFEESSFSFRDNLADS